MTCTPTPEAIDAAERALWKWFEENAASNSAAPTSTDRELAREALTAAAPLMEAQAKAEAWDAVIARIDLGTAHMVDEKYVAGANWVRAQIEDVLKPAATEGNNK